MAQKVKYFTKSLLVEAARKGPKWGYNRQLATKAIRTLPELNFPVVHTLVHHHKGGKPTKPHVRCLVALRTSENPNDGETVYATVDVPTSFYEQLPIRRIA